jgi:hypothetical protein
MKTKLSLVGAALTAVALSLIVSGTAVAQMYGRSQNTGSSKTAPAEGTSPDAKKPGSVVAGGVIVATPITKGEAAKNYPAPKGGYPLGERDPAAHSGLIISPYPPHKTFDCSKIGHNELALDTYAKKVFTRP